MRSPFREVILLAFALLSSHASACAASGSFGPRLWSNFEMPGKHARGPALAYLQSELSSHGSGIDTESAHKYLGYAALLSGGVALFSGSSDDFHQAAGITASGIAFGALVSGFIAHRDYFDMDNGFSVHNMHILLGTLSCIGFGATAVMGSADEEHSGVGSAAAISMVVSVALVTLLE